LSQVGSGLVLLSLVMLGQYRSG